MEKILITPRSLTDGENKNLKILKDAGYDLVFTTAGQLPSETELLKKLPDCVGYLAGVEPITPKVLEAGKKLKVISRNGAGYNNIHLEYAKKNNIIIKTTPGANSNGVAELTIGLILNLLRSIVFSNQKLKNGEWERRIGIELKGRTLGLIGCGRIGQAVANITLSMGMRVMAFDAFQNPDYNPSPQFCYVELEDLLKESDIISFHCPGQPNDEPLLNANNSKLLKRGVYVINTARYSLIDEVVILEKLNNGIVSGLALDAFDSEPPGRSPLIDHDGVLLTPHIGAYTKESVERATLAAINNLLKVLSDNSKQKTKTRSSK